MRGGEVVARKERGRGCVGEARVENLRSKWGGGAVEGVDGCYSC